MQKGLHKGRSSYRRSLQPSKENIQHFKRWKICPFSNLFGSFLPSWIRNRIRNLYADPDPAAQINADPDTDTDPDPKPWFMWIFEINVFTSKIWTEYILQSLHNSMLHFSHWCSSVNFVLKGLNYTNHIHLSPLLIVYC